MQRQLANVLEANPFPGAPPNWTVAIFLDAPPPSDTLERVKGRQGEEIQLGKREIYVAYGEGMGRSKLQMPTAIAGTARNINTITRLVKLAAST